MDALRASYGEEDSSESDSDSERIQSIQPSRSSIVLPPPPFSLLSPPANALDISLLTQQPSRVRSFPHMEGNFALHVYIQVTIPVAAKKELSLFLKRAATMAPELHSMDSDVPLINLIKADQRFDEIALEKVFHVSLGRTVPIRVHQRHSVVALLRQRLPSHKRYWIEFSAFAVFVNDDLTRTFLSIEATSIGLSEIKKRIDAVNEVYRLHNLPEFYENPRPHISVAWALGDVCHKLKRVIEDEPKRVIISNTSGNAGVPQNRLFACKVGGVWCKIGQKTFEISKALD